MISIRILATTGLLGTTLLLGACSLSPASPSNAPIPSSAPITSAPSVVSPQPSASTVMHKDEEITGEQAFLLHMIPHHEEAVSSAKQLLGITKDSKLTKIANDIIAAQNKEIIEMKQWYKLWFRTEYVPDGKFEAMMPDLAKLGTAQAEVKFMQAMIEHHQDAVSDSREAKSSATHAELKKLLDDIVLTQTKEINEFKIMLAARGEKDHDDSGKPTHED